MILALVINLIDFQVLDGQLLSIIPCANGMNNSMLHHYREVGIIVSNAGPEAHHPRV